MFFPGFFACCHTAVHCTQIAMVRKETSCKSKMFLVPVSSANAELKQHLVLGLPPCTVLPAHSVCRSWELSTMGPGMPTANAPTFPRKWLETFPKTGLKSSLGKAFEELGPTMAKNTANGVSLWKLSAPINVFISR